jgi:hypothetical protein
MDGASAEASGGRMPLVESDGSNEDVMIWVGFDAKISFKVKRVERESVMFGLRRNGSLIVIIALSIRKNSRYYSILRQSFNHSLISQLHL